MMHPDDLQQILDILKQNFVNKGAFSTSRRNIPILSVKTGISQRTLYNYIRQLELDPDYNPSDHFNNINRAMSDTLEYELLMEIERSYITPGYYFNNRVLKMLALARWDRAIPEDRLLPTFKASNKWCRNFRRRHNYVWRKARVARMVKITPQKQKQIEEFVQKIEDLSFSLTANDQLDLLVNMDETSWKMCYTGEMTWAKKGSPSVKIHIDQNSRMCLTTLAAVSATGYKLPLYVLAKGKTAKCEEKQVRGIEGFDYQTDHSPSGWSTSDVMVRYLSWLREQMNARFNASDKTIHLVLDMYRSHTCDLVKDTAASHNIQLHFVPAGCTDSLQPLDISVFGALKAKARGYWYQNYSIKPSSKFTKISAVNTLLTCWDQLSEQVTRSAWKQYQNLLSVEKRNDDVLRDIPVGSMDDTREKIIQSIEEKKIQDPDEIKRILDEGAPEDSDRDTIDGTSIDPEDGQEEEEDGVEDMLNYEDYEPNEDDETVDDSEESPEFIYHQKRSSTRPLNSDLIATELGCTPELGRGRECDTYGSTRGEAPDHSATHNPNDVTATASIPNPLVNEEVIITPLEELNCVSSLLDDFIRFEDEKRSKRVSLALSARKKSPIAAETVGLTNVGASCALNAFMQILHLIPNAQEILLPVNATDITVPHLVHYTLSQMHQSTHVIDMTTVIRKIGENNKAKMDLLIDLISSCKHSVLNFVTHCLDKTRYSFMRSGRIENFLQIDGRNFESGLIGVDPTTFGQYVFMLTMSSQMNFIFPLQFQMMYQKTCTTLVLKGLITNPDNHFVAYIRRQFTDEFIEIDDKSIKEGIKKVKNARLALYYVVKQGM